MNPFIRSINELILMTKARDDEKLISKCNETNSLPEDSAQRKRYIKSLYSKGIKLPNINQNTRPKWVKSKKLVSKFFDELDYNSQIHTSSYDLTLIYRQNNSNKDAA